MRLIDADKLIDEIESYRGDIFADEIIELIKQFPVVDTEDRNEIKQLKDMNPGESVIIAGKPWTVLNDVDNGILCLMDDILFEKVFDDSKKGTNNWAKSSLRKELNTSFLEEITNKIGQEPIETIVDLTTNDGLTDYGTCKDKVFSLSPYQYRKYRKLIKKIDKGYWTITADSTCNSYVRFVSSDGSLGGSYAYYGNFGVRPACVFPYSLSIEPIEKEFEVRMFVNAKVKANSKE